MIFWKNFKFQFVCPQGFSTFSQLIWNELWPKEDESFSCSHIAFFLLDRSSTCICGCILRFLQIFRLFIDSHLDRKIIHPNTQVLNTMILFQWQPYFQVTQFHPCSICNVICETHYGLMRCITDSSYKELMINRTKCYVLSSGTIKKSKNIHLTTFVWLLIFGL